MPTTQTNGTPISNVYVHVVDIVSGAVLKTEKRMALADFIVYLRSGDVRQFIHADGGQCLMMAKGNELHFYHGGTRHGSPR